MSDRSNKMRWSGSSVVALAAVLVFAFGCESTDSSGPSSNNGAGVGGSGGSQAAGSGGMVAGGTGGMMAAGMGGTGGMVAGGTGGMVAAGMGGAGGMVAAGMGGMGGAGGMSGMGGMGGGGALTCPANCEPASEYACICQTLFPLVGGPIADLRAHCQTTGLDLANIPNETVNTAIGAALAARGLPANNDGLVYMGFNDQAEEGTYVWFRDGSAITYFNWREGQPNNTELNDFMNGEDCGAIDGAGEWVDLHCTAAAGFLCN